MPAHVGKAQRSGRAAAEGCAKALLESSSPERGKPIAVARIVVIADFLFTATAVIAQPVTGIALAEEAGYSLREGWILLSILLYITSLPALLAARGLDADPRA
jgi:uncharacterized membrane protein